MDKEQQAIALRDNARAELMQIRDIETGIDYLNKVKTIEVWARCVKKDAELMTMAAEQKLRTQRILGELIQRGQDAGEIATSQDHQRNGSGVPQENPGKKSLDEIGVSKKESSAYKKIASIPTDDFERFIDDGKKKVDDAINELTTRGALRLAGAFKQSYDEEQRVTGYLNKMYAGKFNSYVHYKGMSMSEGVGTMIKDFIDRLPALDQSAMRQAYLSSLSMDNGK
jgi:hypothetical protein